MAYVYKRKGLYYWRVNRTLNGVRMPINSQGGFRLRSVATADAQKIEEQVKHGVYQEPTDETFDRYYERWFTTFYEGKASIANDEHFRYALKQIKKYFPKKKLDEISRYDYQGFINDFAKHHAKATVMKAHIYISKCFKEAHNDGLIVSDPSFKIVVIGNDDCEKKEENKFIPLYDFKALIRYTYTHLNPRSMSNYIIFIMANTGMRFEEAAGLTWDCIDFENATIKINKAWNYLHKPYGFIPTKNKSSNRTISIDTSTLAVLRKLKLINNQRTALRPKYNELKLIFYRIENELPVSNGGANKQLKKIFDILRESDQSMESPTDIKFTTHSLRHTHASVLLYHKHDVAYVSRRLGHEKIMTTYNTYVHVIKEMQARNDDGLDIMATELLKD